MATSTMLYKHFLGPPLSIARMLWENFPNAMRSKVFPKAFKACKAFPPLRFTQTYIHSPTPIALTAFSDSAYSKHKPTTPTCVCRYFTRPTTLSDRAHGWQMLKRSVQLRSVVPQLRPQSDIYSRRSPCDIYALVAPSCCRIVCAIVRQLDSDTIYTRIYTHCGVAGFFGLYSYID